MKILRPIKLMVCGLGLGLALALMLLVNAEAASWTKKPKTTGYHATASRMQACAGAYLFQCGPIYNGRDYLGDDPDPFIRAMIQRDLGAKYGGSE